MIDIENLHLNIEGKEILKGIDLHLRPGDTYGLVGPNGAGKSTTIFALLGLLAAWGVMFAVATPYLWAVGASGQNLGAAVFYLALFGTPVVLGFGCLAMALSARTGSVLASLLSTVTLLMLAASPLLIGPGLRGSAIGRAMDAVNPFAGALNTFDSVIIDSEPFSAQTARLFLVTAWLVLCLLAARRSAAHPDFQ